MAACPTKHVLAIWKMFVLQVPPPDFEMDDGEALEIPEDPAVPEDPAIPEDPEPEAGCFRL